MPLLLGDGVDIEQYTLWSRPKNTLKRVKSPYSEPRKSKGERSLVSTKQEANQRNTNPPQASTGIEQIPNYIYIFQDKLELE